MEKSKVVALCFGAGGHEAQMSRLMSLLRISSSDVVVITDSPKDYACAEKIMVAELRGKSKFKLFSIIRAFFISFYRIARLAIRYKIVCVVSTGPGIGLLSSIILKPFGAKIIHIETWSRFYTRSITGRFMYLISDRFYVQNIECMKFYPKAIFSGRL